MIVSSLIREARLKSKEVVWLMVVLLVVVMAMNEYCKIPREQEKGFSRVGLILTGNHHLQIGHILQRRAMNIRTDVDIQELVRGSLEHHEVGDGASGIYENIKETAASHRVHEQSPISESQEPSLEAETQNHLAGHQEEIKMMAGEYKRISELIDVLVKNVGLLKRYGRSTTENNISAVAQALVNFHRYVRRLTRERLCEWGGLGGIVIESKGEGRGPESAQDIVRPISLTEGSTFISKGQKAMKSSANRDKVRGRSQRALGMAESHKVLKLKLEDSPRQNLHSETDAIGQQVESKQPVLVPRIVELRGEPVRLISEKFVAAKISELNAILHGLSFPRPKKMRKFGTQFETRRAIQICFEKCIFQLLNYMFKFGFIHKNDLNSFFLEHPHTLNLTGKHIANLFNVGEGFFFDTVLVPDMNLICTHWYSEHLHELLAALEKKYQGRVLYMVLKKTFTSLSFKLHYGLKNIWAEQVATLFTGGNFPIELENWPKDSMELTMSQINKDLEVEESVKRVIAFFFNPVSIPSWEYEENTRKVDYLMNFYILKFLRTYHDNYLEKYFVMRTNYETLGHQLDLFQAGLGIHRNCNNLFQFQEFIDSPYNQFLPILEQSENKLKAIFKKELKLSFDVYKQTIEKIWEISQVDSGVRWWLSKQSISSKIIQFLSKKAKQFDNLGEEAIASGIEKGCINRTNLWMKETVRQSVLPLKHPKILNYFPPR